MFDRAAPTYDRIGDAYHMHFAERLVDLAAVHGEDSLLDVACGRGAVLLAAARMGSPPHRDRRLADHDRTCGGGPPCRRSRRRRPASHGRGAHWSFLMPGSTYSPLRSRCSFSPTRRVRRQSSGGCSGRAASLPCRPGGGRTSAGALRTSSSQPRRLPATQGPAAAFRPRRGRRRNFFTRRASPTFSCISRRRRSTSRRSNSGGTGTGRSASAGYWNNWSRRQWSPTATRASREMDGLETDSGYPLKLTALIAIGRRHAE